MSPGTFSSLVQTTLNCTNKTAMTVEDHITVYFYQYERDYNWNFKIIQTGKNTELSGKHGHFPFLVKLY